MDCACSIDVDIGSNAAFHISEKRKARKEHKCCECRRTINRGEVYEHVSGQWDGQVITYKTCADCLSIREAFMCSWNYGEVHEAVWEYLRDSNGQIPPECILSLTPAARGRVLDHIQEIWDEEDWEEQSGAYRRVI